MKTNEQANKNTHGDFVDFAQERYYVIHNVDKMKPFFISVVSNVDHWLFVSSSGGLTAGRVSPKTALFPYITVDKIHESTSHTGCKTLFRVGAKESAKLWEPFTKEHDGIYSLSRNIYKNVLGNKLVFEEINHSLNLTFRYGWNTSDHYGFVRQSTVSNDSDQAIAVEMVDGLRNLLPAGTPAFAQTNTSNLVDAYKWSELDESTGLAYLSLYSGISDRAEPCESLKATTVFSLGLEQTTLLISVKQLDAFRAGDTLVQETHTRGMRGAYFVNSAMSLKPNTSKTWRIVADLEKDQSEVVALRAELRNPAKIDAAITQSIEEGSKELELIMAKADGFQETAEENVSVHHYANVLFNVLRGGIFDNQYQIPSDDYAETVKHFNNDVYQRNRTLLNSLPEQVSLTKLLDAADKSGDAQLVRLTYEYLPITFGRRHGDPSRPWNQFAIKVKDEHNDRVLSYEGNWRDIFQNWEALLFSYPGFTEGVIAKFVNASTVEGYNPYRITKEGIDWEVEEPDNPWSYIGYWGDHQIIYLQKLLELSNDFHPDKLRTLLHKEIFSYANVPYRIAAFDNVMQNPKSTVSFDEELAHRIDERVATMGADGKLVLDQDGSVYLVNLIEKLLVPLLGKLGNMVIDGGIWLTTQRPEWNDANNALVGHGLSMVTLYYMRRNVTFLQQLLENDTESFPLSVEVDQWFAETAKALAKTRSVLGDAPLSKSDRYHALEELGQAASHYRKNIYKQEVFSGKTKRSGQDITAMLDDALATIDHSIGTNLRNDGLYHAYNLIGVEQNEISVDTLYPMLEGQVAVLSAKVLKPEEAVTVLDALFASAIYRANQKSFMLYPDRELPRFLDKNRIDAAHAKNVPLLRRMLDQADRRIVVRDSDDNIRFNADFTNVNDLNAMLETLGPDYSRELEASRDAVRDIYEEVFNHKAFTGRSGTMFGFEGLGSIYWHMVSKLLLAVMENFFEALEQNAPEDTCKALGDYYYRVREGIGFNKTPVEYGAFPTDPYSHTPENSGARQPGMTGQVKEEVLCRFAELGVRIKDGTIVFQPSLLREQEFVSKSGELRYADVNGNWHTLPLSAHELAFTWCQVPFIYTLSEGSTGEITLTFDSGDTRVISGLGLSAKESSELFSRSNRIQKIQVTIGKKLLFV